MKNKEDNHSNKILYLILIFVAVFFIGVICTMLILHNHKEKEEPYLYSDFQEDIQSEELDKIEIVQNSEVPTGKVILTFKDETEKNLFVEDVSVVTSELKELGIQYEIGDVKRESAFFSFLPMIIMLVAFGVLFFSIAGKQFGNVSKNANDKKNSKKSKKVTFADVAGLDEEKAELQEVVSFLKTPETYTKLGAKIPKGIMLVGPPGTGKTLLARAVAGEADVPFFHISGSEFEEMFVGVGASRVRKLFAEAKKNAPCIVFIDEIDAVARRRSFSAGGHDENAQTLNQILVEMDGFENDNNIIMIAATNREDILDPAILRPGRFDRRVFVGNPDVGGREAILKIYAKNKPLAEEVSLETLAKTTVGFSGADLENLLNEAAIIAATAGDEKITEKHIDKAFIKVGIGVEKNSKIVSEREKKITAYHESGHALLFHLLPNIGPVHMVSIVPTGNAGGYTMPLPENNNTLQTRGMMLDNIKALYGGRIAEEIMLGEDITTGASQDIKQATEIIRAMVTEYGMGGTGAPLNYLSEASLPGEVQHDGWSSNVASRLDKEIENIALDCYTVAKQLLVQNKKSLEACAQALLEKEKITGEEFIKIVNNSQETL